MAVGKEQFCIAHKLILKINSLVPNLYFYSVLGFVLQHCLYRQRCQSSSNQSIGLCGCRGVLAPVNTTCLNLKFFPLKTTIWWLFSSLLSQLSLTQFTISNWHRLYPRTTFHILEPFNLFLKELNGLNWPKAGSQQPSVLQTTDVSFFPPLCFTPISIHNLNFMYFDTSS